MKQPPHLWLWQPAKWLVVGALLLFATQWQCVPTLCDVDFTCEAPTPHCLTGVCVACLQNGHCALGMECIQGKCTDPSRPEGTPDQQSKEDLPFEQVSQDVTPREPTREKAVGADTKEEFPRESPTERPQPPDEVAPDPRQTQPDPKAPDTAACSNGQKRACYTGSAGTQGKGPCKAGTQTCTAGNWGSCQGQVIPQKERCDGQDNDCDGTIDEGNPDAGAACDTGKKGICKAGTQTCTAGKLVCTQTNQPVTEVCDLKDNNCDGTVDNITPATCYSSSGSTCVRGVFTCSAGKQVCSNTSTLSCSSKADCSLCPGGPGDYTCFIRLRRCIPN